MRVFGVMFIVALALGLVIFAGGCDRPAAVPVPTIEATVVATQAPAVSPTAAAPASPTAPPAATATLPPPATASPSADGPSPADLAARARTAGEYSVEVKLNAPGQSGSGKIYVKDTKLREEATISGQNMVMLVNTETQVAYILVPEQNAAVKADFSEVMAQAQNPSEQISALPADARYVGTETVDGKSASVYEATTDQGPTKYWIWTERGLPLRMETTTSQGMAAIDFSSYQFTPQPDTLFELPPGTQVIELPSGLPGPGLTPTPGS